MGRNRGHPSLLMSYAINLHSLMNLDEPVGRYVLPTSTFIASLEGYIPNVIAIALTSNILDLILLLILYLLIRYLELAPD